MKCLFCKKLCEASLSLKEFNCIQRDHTFYYYKTKPYNIWYVFHVPTNLFLNAEGLANNDDPHDVYSIIKFKKRLRTTSAIKHLQKALKLAAFL